VVNCYVQTDTSSANDAVFSIDSRQNGLLELVILMRKIFTQQKFIYLVYLQVELL
jgi:hypothetical protein